VPVLALIARGKTGLTRCFKARFERGETWMDIVLGEGEERRLGGLVGGFEVLGYLIEGLAYPGIVAPHVHDVWRETSPVDHGHT